MADEQGKAPPGDMTVVEQEVSEQAAASFTLADAIAEAQAEMGAGADGGEPAGAAEDGEGAGEAAGEPAADDTPNDAATDADADIPAEYAGKSPAELIALLEAYKAQAAQAEKPATAEPDVDPAQAAADAEAAEWEAVAAWGQGRAQRAYARLEREHMRDYQAGLVENEEPDAEALRVAAWLEVRDDYREFQAMADARAKTATDPLLREIAPTRAAGVIQPLVEASVLPALQAAGVPADVVDVAGLARDIVEEGLYQRFMQAPPDAQRAFIQQAIASDIGAAVLAGRAKPPAPVADTTKRERKAPPAQTPPDSITVETDAASAKESPALAREMAAVRKLFPSLADDADAIREIAETSLARKGGA